MAKSEHNGWLSKQVNELADLHKPHDGMCDLKDQVCKAYVIRQAANEDSRFMHGASRAKDREPSIAASVHIDQQLDDLQDKIDEARANNAHPDRIRTLKTRFDALYKKQTEMMRRQKAYDSQDRRARLHRALDYALDRVVVGRDAGVVWEVIVGNIGNVYCGPSEVQAKAKFTVYENQSRSLVGRAGGEDVTLLRNNEIVREHVGGTT